MKHWLIMVLLLRLIILGVFVKPNEYMSGINQLRNMAIFMFVIILQVLNILQIGLMHLNFNKLIN